MTIILANDHVGFALKEAVKAHLTAKGHDVTDAGAHGPQSCDYPAYGEKAAREVADGRARLGILICGTGLGISLAANRVKGIRAVVCSEPYTAALSRRHNDCNMLAFGARVVGEGMALAIVDAWLEAAFEGGRHQERLDMLEGITP